MDEGAQAQPCHGPAPRPLRMPARSRDAALQSYRIPELIAAIVIAACAVSVAWGYALAYQVGYEAAEHYYEEVLDA